MSDLDGVLRDCPLDETVLLIEGKPAKEHERARALGLRGTRCAGSAARLRAYLRDEWHPRHAELVALHDRLYGEGECLMAESRGLRLWAMVGFLAVHRLVGGTGDAPAGTGTAT